LKIAELIVKQRIPIIVHLRGDLWREFFAWIRRSSFKSRLLGSPVFLNSLLGVGLADMLTPICRWLEGEVLKHLPSKHTEVVYQGVDPSDFYPSRGLDLSRPAVAIIQNHTVYEKTLGLLRFASAVERLPDIHFYITTGENVKQTFLPQVKSAFSKFKNVHFIADIHHPDGVRRLLSDSDLYALPSYLDCCPTTVLEASLMERPVVASRVGGIPEIIVDGKTGWSIANDRTDEWVEKIRILIDDPRLSRRLGRQGRRWVSDNFGWPTIASQVERLIKNEAEGFRRKASRYET
jgi:glycosyltransferase involved in cell wall biosynthesis